MDESADHASNVTVAVPPGLPRGIEKSGKGFRVTVSVGGVPKRQSGFATLDTALAARDELDGEAKELRERKKHTGMLVGTLDNVPAGSLTNNGTVQVVGYYGTRTRPTNWGINSKLVKGVVKYSARRWVKGKMRWGGMHDSIEAAIVARDALGP